VDYRRELGGGAGRWRWEVARVTDGRWRGLPAGAATVSGGVIFSVSCFSNSAAGVAAEEVAGGASASERAGTDAFPLARAATLGRADIRARREDIRT